jgi:hypothetical protein
MKMQQTVLLVSMFAIQAVHATLNRLYPRCEHRRCDLLGCAMCVLDSGGSESESTKAFGCQSNVANHVQNKSGRSEVRQSYWQVAGALRKAPEQLWGLQGRIG